MADKPVSIQRALVSVSEKTGLAEFATALQREFGIELISTGGTAKHLRDAGLTVTDVSDVTGFPEMMDGRVKTLHPLIHGGLLALRDEPGHVQSMHDHNIRPIDLVIINLYPFKQTIDKPDVTFAEAIENIDIGGPGMVRSAAKNHRFVTVITAVLQYKDVLDELRQQHGSTTLATRAQLAQQAFALTHAYDGLIADYLERVTQTQTAHLQTAQADATPLPLSITLQLYQKQLLRYGENPHQPAALYVTSNTGAGVAHARQLHGKELSYINLLDADAALNAVNDLSTPAACIVKHATPCGLATADDLAAAFDNAYASDPIAAFGGIVAVNRLIDLITARHIVEGQKFLEVIVAPAYSDDALELLKQRWKNCRLLQCDVGSLPTFSERGQDAHTTFHAIQDGFLVQVKDDIGIIESEWKVVSSRQPTSAQLQDLKLAWIAVKHVKSNAIVIARDRAVVGIGGGQVDRVGAARIAISKAGKRAAHAVAASDAFFPFPDGPAHLLDAGINAIIQPGGSVRDNETIELINQNQAVMIVTGRRHFRH
jgi:phosphoribosylaminoimidazolecarboxamide formyltransferase / IMP cyclohydrolase